MKKKNVLLFSMLFLMMLPACQPAQAPATEAVESVPPTVPPAPTSTPAPSDTPQPTSTPLPTETQLPTNTPLPEGVLFRDDFNGALQPGWEWQDENPDKWSFTKDGWLQIVGEHDALLSENRQNNLLWYPLPEGDIVITVHLKTKPFENFQQASIYFYEDPQNYVTINRGFCAPCAPGGNGFYMDYKIGGAIGNYNAKTDAEDVYLRLESKGGILSGYYATAPDEWIRLGRFGNFFQFKKVGIGVSNVRSPDDVVGQFDYFEISLP